MNPGSENGQTEEEAVERMLTDIDAVPGARYLSAVFRLHPCGVHGSAFDPVRGETVYSGFDLFFFTRLREHVRMNLLDSHLRQLARAWSGKRNTRVFFHPVCPESAVPELHDTLFLQMLKRDGILFYCPTDKRTADVYVYYHNQSCTSYSQNHYNGEPLINKIKRPANIVNYGETLGGRSAFSGTYLDRGADGVNDGAPYFSSGAVSDPQYSRAVVHGGTPCETNHNLLFFDGHVITAQTRQILQHGHTAATGWPKDDWFSNR